MDIEDRSLQPAASDLVWIEDLVDHVISILAQKMPDGEIETCEDFKGLGIECCDGCHLYHPETGMTLVPLLDGRKAWVCCSLRTALEETAAVAGDSSELVDLEEVLVGKIRGTPTPVDSDGQRTPSRKK